MSTPLEQLEEQCTRLRDQLDDCEFKANAMRKELARQKNKCATPDCNERQSHSCSLCAKKMCNEHLPGYFDLSGDEDNETRICEACVAIASTRGGWVPVKVIDMGTNS
jgi:hypothetical protein